MSDTPNNILHYENISFKVKNLQLVHILKYLTSFTDSNNHFVVCPADTKKR